MNGINTWNGQIDHLLRRLNVDWRNMQRLIVLLVVVISTACINTERKNIINIPARMHDYPVAKVMPETISSNALLVLTHNTNLIAPIFDWLYAESILPGKKRNYIGMYHLLSESYLQNRFPAATNANLYAQNMANGDENYYIDFISIDLLLYTEPNILLVTVTLDAGMEGEINRIQEVLAFTNQRGNWKFNEYKIK